MTTGQMATDLESIAENTQLLGKSWTDGIITDSDTTTYDPALIAGLFVITTGNVVLDDANGNTLTLTAVNANTFLSLRPTKIMAATTATISVIYK
jgi:hypothetical protein